MAQKKTQAKKAPAKKAPAKKAPTKKAAAKKAAAKKAATKKKAPAKKTATPKKPEVLDVITKSVSETQWNAVEEELHAVAERAQREIATRKGSIIKRVISWLRS